MTASYSVLPTRQTDARRSMISLPKIRCRPDAIASGGALSWRSMFTNARVSVIVFSHVDGVLADPHTPRFARAAAVLRALKDDDTALVLCSGKTRAELGLVQHALDIRHPFVSENGGAVYIPEG